MVNNLINYSDFEKINIRLGTIIVAIAYDKLKKPSILHSIDQKIMDDYILPSIPMKRLAKVDEIAKMALFLIDKGEYITGQVMHVNGGLYM